MRTFQFLALAAFAAAPAALAQNTNTVLVSFNGAPSDGADPYDKLIFDSSGNLYGTTSSGGNSTNCPGGCGTVFELTPTSGGGWAEKLLYSFQNGNDGSDPYAGLVRDTRGSLYGTTVYGGSAGCGVGGCGTVFKLTEGAGGKWTEKLLYAFTGMDDGAQPFGGLILNKSGDLFGTTVLGGAYFGGVVFELTPTASGPWIQTALHAFGNGQDGTYPEASLVFGSAGQLYGTARGAGDPTCSCGIVFELTPSDGLWAEQILYTFTDGNDGATPYSPLILDKSGNLYGTTSQGGPDNGGTVFKLTAGSTFPWTETLLHSFTRGTDGGNPMSGLVFDSSGNLYGTTPSYGLGGGVVYKLARGAAGRWQETVLLNFIADSIAAYPQCTLIFGSDGNLYGTAVGGGLHDLGAVFSVTP